ncbi:hypothetical protein GGR51DRAFT_561346 [Nemania sp. FL0031]|nr:hypothetical protein GGR51DRAFT_561346 [Nemania sp. FL0031]
MQFDVEDLLGDFDVSFVDGLWIALVAIEAGIILGVFGYRVFRARGHLRHDLMNNCRRILIERQGAAHRQDPIGVTMRGCGAGRADRAVGDDKKWRRGKLFAGELDHPDRSKLANPLRRGSGPSRLV